MASNREDPLPYTNNPPSSSSPITVSDYLDSAFLTNDPSSSLLGSASNSYQNDSGFLAETPTCSSDAEFGFSRPDFRQSPLAGTVQFYERHVFLCYKNPSVWPPRVEAAEFDRLPRLLSAAVLARKADMKKEVCDFVLYFTIYFMWVGFVSVNSSGSICFSIFNFYGSVCVVTSVFNWIGSVLVDFEVGFWCFVN